MPTKDAGESEGIAAVLPTEGEALLSADKSNPPEPPCQE